MLRKLAAAAAVFAVAAGCAFALDVSARSASLYDPLTGEYYYLKNASERRPMASTTKIMTAAVALSECKLDEIVEIKREYTTIEGSKMYLQPGEKVTMRELLTGLLLSSGNDAAEAIAGYISGSDEKFASLMNETAHDIGLTDTSFANPSGLDDDDHYTTAKDYAVVGAYAMENENFRELVSTRTAKTDSGRVLTNHNKLLVMYDKCDGIKTGFTKKSGRCLVSSASDRGRHLIAVTLSAGDDWSDHMRMMEYGFSLFKDIKIAENGTCFTSVDVAGEGKKALFPADDVNLALTDSDVQKVETVIFGRQLVYPPFNAGDTYGEAVWMINGVELARTKLVFGESVQAPDEHIPGFREKLAEMLRFW